MNIFFTIYSVFFLATAMVSFFVAFLAWKRRLVKAAIELTWLMIAAGIGAFWVIFETSATGIADKVFWSKLEYIGGVATPVLYFIFVLRFTGKDKFISSKNILLLFIIPVITLLLTITNEKHLLIWSGFSAISEKTNLMEYYHGIGFWIGYIAYTYLMLFWASIYLFRYIIRRPKTFFSQGWIVFIAGLCPWIASAIYLSGSNPIPGLDIAPISIVLSGALTAYAILYTRFLDLVSVARETLVEFLPDGILVLDEQNRIQDINNAALSFLGIPNKKIIGFPAVASGATVVQLMDAVINHAFIDQIEVQNHDEIHTFSIIKQSVKTQLGSRLIIIRDITNQVIWQKKIQSAEERYRQMFAMFRLMADNTEDFLWAKDINNKFTFVNKTMCDQLLIANNVDEPIGKTDIFFANREKEANPENPDWYTFGEIYAKNDSIAINERKSKQFDEYGNVKGNFLFLDVHKSPIWDEQGSIIGIVGTARDVTHTRQLEKEKSIALESLRKSEENLRKLNAEKDKYFSIISHDLRSPFNSFLGLTQIMAEDLPNLTMDEIQKFAASMKNSATNLFRLLENLLEWAQIQQGLIPFSPNILHLKSVVNESIEMILEPAKNKGVEIVCDVPDDIEVYADTNMLQTVIRNLVSNGLKFTPQCGSVSIFAHSADGKVVEVSIRDRGIGMSQFIMDHLFNLDINTNRKGTEGEITTGLGLIICKDFIEKHSGKLWVESEEGKGSNFNFSISCNAK